MGYLESETLSVFIENEAFRRIVLHTAQFAHFDLKVRNWKEVYGFLSGYIDEETQWVHVTSAYPITHGTHYGVEFKKEHYVLSAYLNLYLAEKKEWFVGWYHSHPGLSLFLSETDIINQLGYQIANPKAIALVFDHTKIISKEPPIAVFQLDNPQFGVSSSYHVVEYFIGGVQKKEELKSIKDVYYEIETNVIENKIPLIEKEVSNEIREWRKRTKTKIDKKEIIKKKKGK